MCDSPFALNSETECEGEGSPDILGPTPPKRQADGSRRRLNFPHAVSGFYKDQPRCSTPKPPSTHASRQDRGLVTSAPSLARTLPVSSPNEGPASPPHCSSRLPQSASTPLSSRSANFDSSDSGVQLTPSDMSKSLQDIVSELQESNRNLKVLTKKMEDIDRRVQTLEDADGDDEGDGGSVKNGKKRKRKLNGPSKDIRSLVRRTYSALKEHADQVEDKTFEWDLSSKFDTPSNQAVMIKLAEEVKALNPTIASTSIREAARTYFHSLSLKQSLEDSGKYLEKCAGQRRKNRKKRKLEIRKASLAKLKTLDERSKQKWKVALVIDMMSSEESEWLEENDGLSIKTYNTRPLVWRAKKVNEFFHHLDQAHQRTASQRSKEMTRGRSEGIPSDNPKPIYLSKYTWLFR